ncbi:hypothetical protein ACFQY0_10580 [Haloferula chungangensis]|uniref:DUF1328 domain-containing protein n=1 Tax=Haloferula chungangensis TaxID=1048331 RepID=A0ABW2L5H6_9BACT
MATFLVAAFLAVVAFLAAAFLAGAFLETFFAAFLAGMAAANGATEMPRQD